MLAVAAAALLGLAIPAGASADVSAQILGLTSYQGGNAATVKVRYTCDQPGLHLWVSAKQVADGSQDPALEAEGSSAAADAWLQRHPTNLVCDNQSHLGFFKINKSEYGFGQLGSGFAWLQFCLTQGDDLLVNEFGWFTVRMHDTTPV
jgi:hypothetical protein